MKRKKRIKLKARERLGQMRYLLRTRGPLSLTDLAKLMGYADKAGLQGLLWAHGLPEDVTMYREPSYGMNGGGGNWYRHIFVFKDSQRKAA